MILGFTAGGWVTGATARQMADTAAEEARAELAASVCIEKFMTGHEFATNLAALKKENSWSQDNFIIDGGWAVLAGMEDPVDGAAELCAERLTAMDEPKTTAKTTETRG